VYAGKFDTLEKPDRRPDPGFFPWDWFCMTATYINQTGELDVGEIALKAEVCR
jgi:hypothetical protein